MTDRDEKGRLRPGHKGSNQYTREQQDTQSDTPLAEPFLGDPDNSDDVVIYVSRNYGRKGLPKDGQIGYYVWLMTERSADFNAQHSKAVSRKAEAQAIIAGAPKVDTVIIDVCPTNHFVPGPEMEKMWKQLHGHPTPSTDEPPARPTLVVANPDAPPNVIQFGGSDDDDDDEPPQSA